MKGFKFREYNPLRLVYKLLFELIAIPVIALILPGAEINSYIQLILLITLTSAVFGLIWPFIARRLLTVLIYSAGILNLLLNTLIIWLLAQIFPDLHIESLFTAFLISAIVMGFRMLADAIFHVGEESSFYRLYTRYVAYKNSPIKSQIDSNHELEKGTIFIEIDGLSADVLKFAIRNGYMPTLRRLIDENGYKLREWVCEYGASTPVCQAGILHGENSDMPAFRWFDRKKQEVITGHLPKYSSEVLKKISDGDGLLSDYGLSIGNIFTGDADESVATFSKLSNKKDRGLDYFYYYFLNPDNYLRSFLLFWLDVISECKDQLYLQAYKIQPRMRKPWSMPFVRGFLSVFMRDMLTAILIGKMYEGVKNVYIVFAGYDYIAHESGLERGEAIKALTQTDRKIDTIMKAAETSPRKYQFVFLSDHGQSQGASFKQRYGFSLEQYISEIVDNGSLIESAALTDLEALDQLGLILNTKEKDRELLYKALGETTKKDRRQLPTNQELGDRKTIVCLSSGNQAEIYFKGNKRRLTMEEINALHPRLIPLLANHPGVGFLSLLSEAHGPIVIGKKGKLYLDSDRVVGLDPLRYFGKYSRDQLKHVNSYSTAADIIVNSTLYRSSDEIAPFEEFISSHGGLGGGQTKPFVLFPSHLKHPEGTIYRSTELHKVLKGWSNTSVQ